MKTLLILDLDDTLLNKNKEISNKTLEFLKNNPKYIIILASSKNKDDMLKYYNELMLTSLLISNNGAFLGIPKNNEKPLYNANFCQNEIDDLLQNFNEDIVSAFYKNNNVTHVYNYIERLERFYNATILDTSIINFLNNSILSLTLIIKATKMNEFENYLNSKTYYFRFFGSDTKNAIYQIYKDEVDKSSTLNLIFDYYKNQFGDVIVFGDSTFDIPLFKKIKHSVAMENSPNDVKSVAAYVTKYDNNNDGIYHYLTNLL